MLGALLVTMAIGTGRPTTAMGAPSSATLPEDPPADATGARQAGAATTTPTANTPRRQVARKTRPANGAVVVSALISVESRRKGGTEGARGGESAAASYGRQAAQGSGLNASLGSPDGSPSRA